MISLLKNLSLSRLCLLFLLTGCSPYYLRVHTDYLTQEDLASYHVNTPDPYLLCPPEGQRLQISWSIPKSQLALEDLHLLIQIRFHNNEEITEKIMLRKASGRYIYSLLNNDFCTRGGIRTYKVNLIGGGCILEEKRHLLWAELIKFIPKKRE